MIFLYSGTPGSFKSYHAVAESLDWLRMGRNLITNFPLDYKKKIRKPIKGDYQFLTDEEITVDYLVDYARCHHHRGVKAQTLVVIDEASLKFNSRDYARRDRMTWINFLANHRHFNFDFILIAQNDRMLDRQIRCLIETEYKHRAIKNLKTIGFLIDLFFRGAFMCIEYWYPCKMQCGTQFKVFHKRIADCYDTMALFVKKDTSDTSDTSEVKKQDVKNQGSDQQKLTLLGNFCNLLNYRISCTRSNGFKT